jgi:hypothetical protein
MLAAQHTAQLSVRCHAAWTAVSIADVMLSSLPMLSMHVTTKVCPDRWHDSPWLKTLAHSDTPSALLFAGITGSQLDGTQTGGVANCPSFSSPRQVYADLTWLKNLQCFAHMMSVVYDGNTKRCVVTRPNQQQAAAAAQVLHDAITAAEQPLNHCDAALECQQTCEGFSLLLAGMCSQ